jgi:hypothetical protein
LKSRVSQAIFALAIVTSQALVSAYAFTLGDLRGAAVIGRPLDITVLVQTGEGEEASASCIRAEVFHADVPQASPRVSVTPGRDGGQQALVHIESSAYVDEPVVTVLVRASCGSTTQRRYVLLADFPVVPDMPATASAGAPNVPLVQAPAEMSQGAQAGSSDALGATLTSKPVSVSRSAAPVKPKQRQKGVAAATPSRPASIKSAEKTKRAAVKSPRAVGQAVLKLDPLEVLSDRVDAADSFMDFSPAEDALRFGRQITALENDLKALRAQSASSEKLMLDLRAKLQQAEQGQMSSGLLYALLAALAGSLMLAFWLWRARQADKQAASGWWNSVAQVPAVTVGVNEPINTQPTNLARDAASAAEVSAVVAAPQPVVVPGSAKATPVVPQKVPSALPMPDASGLDVDLDLAFSGPMPLDGVDNATANVPFATNSIRHISLDPILDARQQAEFFVSLGQTDRALVILKKQISEANEPNPLLYLDLISLYHSLGMKADFREQRDIFHRLFNGVIPDFPAYNLPGRDLESYPEVISVLVRLWPRVDALAFLSACIFHDAQRLSRQTYDLTAFKDLLMLHTLADAVVDQSSPAYQSTSHLEFDEDGVAHLVEETNLPIVTRSLDLDFSALEPDRPNTEAHLAPDIDLDDTLAAPGKQPL